MIDAPRQSRFLPFLRRTALAWLAASACCAASTHVGAQDRARVAESGNLEEIIVTAQKRSQRLEDVPMSIAVVGGDDLDRSSVAGTTDVLSTIPAVAITTGITGGGTQVAVRGVTAAGAQFSGSSPIAYYIDSVPFGFVRTAIGPDLSPYDLDRIEVLRGPQGTLYGASALNGVIRVLTKDPDLSDASFKARTSVSSTDEGGGSYGADAALNVPLVEGKLGARAVVGYQERSGWIDNPVRNNINSAELRNYRLKVKATPTEQLTIGASAWQRRDDLDGLATSDDDFRVPQLGAEPSSIDLDAYGFDLNYVGAGFSIAGMTSYVDYKNVALLDLGGISFLTDLRSKVFTQELIVSSSDDAAWHWAVGAFYRDAEDHTNQLFDVDTFTEFKDMSESMAVFGEIGRRFGNDRFEWTLGLRYFEDDGATKGLFLDPVRYTSTSDATTPRAVLRWMPGSQVSFYVSYSEGFRSGFPQDELVTDVAPSLSPLKPDKLKNYEIGAKGSLGPRLSFDAAVFYVDWNDTQQVIGVPIPGSAANALAFASVNGESASGMGYELALTGRPVDALDLRLSVAWNDLTLDDDVFSGGARLYQKGDRLSQSPEYTAGVSAEYSIVLGASGYEASLMAGASYTSKQKNSTITATAFGDNMLVSRLRLGVDAPEHWSAALFVDNLGDERGTPLKYIPGLDQYDARIRPRTVGAQIEYRF